MGGRAMRGRLWILLLAFAAVVFLQVAPKSRGASIAMTAAAYDGVSREMYDCSAYVQKVYADCGIEIPRTSYDQAASGNKIFSADLSELRAGDIICFGSEPGAENITHVGIYDGDGRVWHSSSSEGRIKADDLEEWIGNGYEPPYRFAVRILPE